MTTKPNAAAERSVTLTAITKEETRSETMAKLSVDGILPLALTADMLGRGLAGEECDLTATLGRMTETAKAVEAGDLRALEHMLSAQALTLNLMFTELTRRASMNMGQHLPAVEAYLRLALKAQAQSRATVEALAEIKNPRAVAFVKQANIAQQQQVNNGTPPPILRAGKSGESKNELLGDARDEQQWVDARATPAPARGNPAMETVGAIHRADDA